MVVQPRCALGDHLLYPYELSDDCTYNLPIMVAKLHLVPNDGILSRLSRPP
jgi:hypothetical protein